MSARDSPHLIQQGIKQLQLNAVSPNKDQVIVALHFVCFRIYLYFEHKIFGIIKQQMIIFVFFFLPIRDVKFIYK